MTGIIKIVSGTPYSEGMKIHAGPAVLSLFVTDSEAYFFDRSGRFFAAWREGWFISFGLSGRNAARRWGEGKREIRSLKPRESAELEAGAKSVLAAACDSANAEERRWLKRAMAFDRSKDCARFKQVYRPIGILPPDHYHTCVVPVTEGCGWNRCHFCSFYRGQTFRLKDPREIRDHLERIKAFLGDGLSLRRSIFLGEANALQAPLDLLVYTMKAARQLLIPRMPEFRGFYSFSEGSPDSRSSTADFRMLARLGLQRVYFGLETGQTVLRGKLRKPGTLESLGTSIEHAKAAGVKVAMILLAGTGGTTWADRHERESVRFIQQLPLDGSDIVFISPLYGPDGTSEPPLSAGVMENQISRLKKALQGTVRVAPYDIREFVY